MKKKYNVKGVNGNILIDFTEEAVENIDDANGSLVIPYYKGNIVMTYHLKRKGWEFPAGKKEEGETIVECALRETYEETGAILTNIKPLGYYLVKNEQHEFKIAIFIGQVNEFETKPRWSETDLVKLFDELPENISYNDDVYEIVLNYIRRFKLDRAIT
ncbi:NUDIX domain-containing protein [Thermohalobacter berrensis]|uniref:Nudix hydrolase domain-containing protein n=1 Tax=Thermohalobacter berrensis TaxID=99594 RepID=A0A419T232_9FIRM|nr:NUDIX domain-containing protein [Thermohalobacter berrensis]RKD31547.1 hypothetical protein BET03_12320 [Thermohalobacter berrensis]